MPLWDEQQPRQSVKNESSPEADKCRLENRLPFSGAEEVVKKRFEHPKLSSAAHPKNAASFLTAALKQAFSKTYKKDIIYQTQVSSLMCIFKLPHLIQDVKKHKDYCWTLISDSTIFSF